MKDYHSFMKTINNMIGFDSNDKAKTRLRCLDLLTQHGYQAVMAVFPGVSRTTVYRWQKKYRDSGYRLSSLIPLSTKPKKVRQMQVPVKILSFIKLMRGKYPDYLNTS